MAFKMLQIKKVISRLGKNRIVIWQLKPTTQMVHYVFADTQSDI